MAKVEQAVFMNMCMIYDDNGNILVQDRLKKDWPGVTFPGGHVEYTESFTQSVIREVKEETGLDIETVKLVDGVEEPYSQGKLNGMYEYLSQHAIELGYDTLYVDEIYHFNEGSRRCFEKCGFIAYEETKKGKKYKLKLD